MTTFTRVPAGLLVLTLVGPLAGCGDRDDARYGPPPPTGSVGFVVFGDQPYADADVAAFPEMVAAINATGAPFIIHVGDIKAGGDACTDSVIIQRRELYRGFSAPMAFTPGDNEWTDCHRAGAAPLERLAFLRDSFYGPEGLPLPPGTVVQGGPDGDGSPFVENLRWVHEGVVYATAHVVGSDNARADFDGRTEADDEAVARREDAVRRWVEETFAEATRIGARAVVIASHADVRFDAVEAGAPRAAYVHLLDALEAGVRGFDGPVLLLQGDTHSCLFDQPAFAEDAPPLPNFYRLRVAGGARQVGWVEVTLPVDGDTAVEVRPQMLRGSCRL